MFFSKKKVAVLGDCDDGLVDALRVVLRRLGAKEVSSYLELDLTITKVAIDGKKLTVKTESYEGVSIRGPVELVDRIVELVEQERG